MCKYIRFPGKGDKCFELKHVSNNSLLRVAALFLLVKIYALS